MAERGEAPSVPACVGIIMDGNRRWARARGLPTVEGHRAGYEKLKEVVRWAKARGIGTVVIYAFSTENWNRSAEEVGYLMDLFRTVLSRELGEIEKEDLRITFIGERERFADDLRTLMENVEAKTAGARSGRLVVALSYGGRAEILAAAAKLAAAGVANPSEEEFAGALWTAGIPDPDLVIRTGGERRLSNFLPWQSVYSELFFSATHWPDFSEREFDEALADFASRTRRRGA